jgi:general secretion pathway protein G
VSGILNQSLSMKKQVQEDGFTLIDLLASIAIVAMLVVPQLIMAFERARQRRTMGDMRNLATALSTYQVDNGGEYPSTGDGLAGLTPDYYAGIPTDGWRNAYFYAGVTGGNGTCGYLLYGLGTDAAVGPTSPDPWIGDEFEPDIMLINGTFFAGPGRPNETAQIPTALAAGCT